MLTLLTLALVFATGCDDESSAVQDVGVAADAMGDPVDVATSDARSGDATPGARDMTPAEADAAPPEADAAPIGGDRPVALHVPAGPPPRSGWPLVVLLHGFRANPTLIDRNFPFSARVDADGIILAIPIGVPNDDGFLRWEADLDIEGDAVSRDVPYLLDAIDAVVARHGANPDRVFVMGHSNGGAMAVHLACKAADRIAGFINVSGVNPYPAQCDPVRPTTALFIHGTADDQVAYDGRDDRPGADDGAAWWAERAGCVDPVDAEPVDLEVAPGAETTVRSWTCAGDVTVQRWRMEGTGHLLVPNPAFLDEVLRALGL